LTDAQVNHSHLLEEELQQDASDNEQRDDLGEREEAKARTDDTECDERAVRNAVARMNGSEKAEVVAITCGGKRHA
jgi:hypothetical protein